MRLTKWQVELLAFEVARELLKGGEVTGDAARVEDVVRNAITEDLLVEEKLDDEVREILKTHAGTMKSQNVDYSVFFEKVKKQLIRERKLVL